jgi:hypothetical protein
MKRNTNSQTSLILLSNPKVTKPPSTPLTVNDTSLLGQYSISLLFIQIANGVSLGPFSVRPRTREAPKQRILSEEDGILGGCVVLENPIA